MKVTGLVDDCLRAEARYFQQHRRHPKILRIPFCLELELKEELMKRALVVYPNWIIAGMKIEGYAGHTIEAVS